MTIFSAFLQPAELRRYATSFPINGQPLSESTAWRNNGLDWTVVNVLSNVACGTQTGTAGPPFNDSYAYLYGFPKNHCAIGTVFRSGSIDSTTREFECLVRWSDSPHVAQGYEFNYAWNGAYCGIVKWNGALNDFTPLGAGTPNGSLNNGDLIRLDAIGSTISAYRSTDSGATWVLCHQVTDMTYAGGNPGIGFWKDGGTNGNSNLGMSHYVATGLP